MRRAGKRLAGLLGALWVISCSQESVDLGELGAGASDSRMRGSYRGAPVVEMRDVARVPVGPSTPPPVILIPPARPPSSGLLRDVPRRDALTPPIAGGTLAVAADGSRAIAADPDRDVLHIVDLGNGAVRSLQLPPGSEPGRVSLDDAGHAHVVLRSAGKLARAELASARLELSDRLCDEPRGLAFDRGRGELALVCADGALLGLDPGTHAVRRRQQLPRDLRDVVIAADGTRFVSRQRSAELLRLDAAGVVLQRERPARLPRLVNPFPIDAAGPPRLAATSGDLAYRSVAAPDGIWMLHQRAQDDEIPLRLGYLGGNCGPIVQPSLTRFDASGHVADSLQLHAPFSLGVDLALSAQREWLAIAAPAAYIQGAPTATLQWTEILLERSRIAPGIDTTRSDSDLQREHCSPPRSIELSHDAQAVAVAFDAQATLYIQNRVPARLDVVRTVAPAQSGTHESMAVLERSITLAADVVQDLGHEIFHGASNSSGLSCASCHGEAVDDGHVWSFESVGPRRTQSLRGGLSQTLPLQWDGQHAGLPALLEQVYTKHMGGSELPPGAAEALGQWLDKLPALRVQAADPAAAERGKRVFESAQAGCAECHAGPALTNNQSVDVGTGGVFQVPSLRGLALRAPYLHDGRALELEAVVYSPPSHGAGASLSAEQRADLLSYLNSL